MNPLAVSSSETTTTDLPITHTEEEKDKKYSHEIAKRSVARAALHLGITSMSSEALDVMGDALITFLERLGGYIAESAECSGRTSSHCNVLDALNGIECMIGNVISTEAPFGNAGSSNNYAMAAGSSGNDMNHTAWEALAAFGYGAAWRQKAEIDTTPNTAATPNNEEESSNGWNAPYLDVIPNYPLRRNGNLKSIQYKALEEEACNDKKDKEETSKRAQDRLNHVLNSIPDVFWGSEIPISNEDKVKKDEEDETAPPTKRVKLSISETQKPVQETIDRPAYLPSFLPSFPPFYTYQHPTSQLNLAQQQHYDGNNTIDSSMNVRRSLVQLHQSSQADGDNSTVENNSLVVPLGVEGDKVNSASVTALTKASGSRIPRILEGSMDTVPC